MSLKARIHKKFASHTVDCSFYCKKGEFLALSGPSGIGKTTIIRCLAGLERPGSGIITLHGETWFDSRNNIFRPPQKRKTSYVFQDYTLFPHLNVEGNILFACNNKTLANELLDLFSIEHLRSRKIKNLSGGEKQRVALAQALVRQPRLLLLDEPFSALDSQNMARILRVLETVKRSRKTTIVLVTHNLDEVQYIVDHVTTVTGQYIRDACNEGLSVISGKKALL